MSTRCFAYRPNCLVSVIASSSISFRKSVSFHPLTVSALRYSQSSRLTADANRDNNVSNNKTKDSTDEHINIKTNPNSSHNDNVYTASHSNHDGGSPLAKVSIQHQSNWALPDISSLKSKLKSNTDTSYATSAAGKSPPTSFKDKFSIINSIKPVSALHKSTKQLLRDPKVPEWKKQKEALKLKFGSEGWNPRRKLSREEMRSVRFLKQEYPHLNNKHIADYFKVSPEAIRRILKSKWEPKNIEEDEEVYERWKRRGAKIKDLLNSRSNRKGENSRYEDGNGEGQADGSLFMSESDKFNMSNGRRYRRYKEMDQQLDRAPGQRRKKQKRIKPNLSNIEF